MEPIEILTGLLQAGGIAYKEQEPLKKHTSFKIGGPAALYCEPQSEEQLLQAIRAARQASVPYYFLGNGSNILFCDAGYNGLILCLTNALGNIHIEKNVLVAGAGAELSDACLAASSAGLSGMEFAYGIPGSVGGAIFMNAGAYDGEMSQVVKMVTYLDENLRKVTRKQGEFAFGYRQSVFQHKDWCILSVCLALLPGDKEEIGALMQRNMANRREKQPLEYPSAGSAFKRPEGAFAGELIDRCGLRGFRIGGAAISEKHCGFIVNLGDATCDDVLTLATKVQQTVKEKTGYELEKEIRVVVPE